MSLEVTEPELHIALVTIHNERRRNALDEETFRALAALWPRLAVSSMRCVVLTGAGDCFCSGADLSQPLTDLADVDDLVRAALIKHDIFSIPIVAAIEGACVAGGLELALSCDVRIASTSARFGLPEARWGIFPAGGSAMRLAAEIGFGRASDLLLSGRVIGSDEALACGLVGRVVPKGTALDEAADAARMIAANSPEAVRAIKTYLQRARQPSAELIALEGELTRALRASEDAKEGPRAFLEKRVPLYS